LDRGSVVTDVRQKTRHSELIILLYLALSEVYAKPLQEPSLLAKDVNDNARCLNQRVIQTFFVRTPPGASAYGVAETSRSTYFAGEFRFIDRTAHCSAVC
jgi:hypothetical protein